MSRPWFAINDCGLVREFPSYEEADRFAWPLIKAGESWSIRPTKPAAAAQPTAEDYREAGRRVSEGIFAAMGPDRSAGYVVNGIDSREVGSYERADHALASAAHIQLQDRRDIVSRCIAAFDRSLERIAANRDIVQFLEAAE